MSLGIIINGPEGVVLASDTRVTLMSPGSSGTVSFDNASKMLLLDGVGGRVAAVTQGDGTIGGRTIHSLVPAFRAWIGDEHFTVQGYAQRLSDFFMHCWQQAGSPPSDIHFIVGGIDLQSAYGEAHRFQVPSQPVPLVQRAPGLFGMSWGGQSEIASRLINGFDYQMVQSIVSAFPSVDMSQLIQVLQTQSALPIPYSSLPLQDCVDLAIFLMRATITAQGLSTGLRGVGGTIEVITITPTEGVQWIQKREIRGERT